MTVYVDQLIRWPTKIRCFRGGSCHMVADTLEELHAMAVHIGLSAAWFQRHDVFDHYDLTPTKRGLAVAAGAQELRGVDMVRRFSKRRGH